MSDANAVPVRVPTETVNDERVKLVAWRAADGTKIAAGSVVAEIETSKSVLEVTAGSEGYLRQTAKEGDWIAVGGVFCYLTEGPGDPLPAAEETETASAGPALSRKARVLLEREGVDPSVFSGKAMVREADVREYLDRRACAAAKGAGVRREELSARKRAETAALLGGGTNVLRSAVAMRFPVKALRAALEKTPAFAATPAALFVFEAARVLRELPLFNAYYDAGAAAVYERVNVGFVVDDERGLRVPVLHGADAKDEDTVAKEMQDLLLAYYEDSLETEQLSAGTFTVTDLSGEGVTRFDPLINAAQSAILGIAASDGDSFEVVLAFDHRLHEGRSAAGFLKELLRRIEARG
jgi:pyruvate/2-oxoglutarate dehydrogenase complex dihydrolipoamide acyltransferase (E2) component